MTKLSEDPRPRETFLGKPSRYLKHASNFLSTKRKGRKNGIDSSFTTRKDLTFKFPKSTYDSQIMTHRL